MDSRPVARAAHSGALWQPPYGRAVEAAGWEGGVGSEVSAGTRKDTRAAGDVCE